MTETPQIDAENIKREAIQAAKESLITALQGDKSKYSWEQRGKDSPETYDELFNEAKKQIPTISQDDIDARVEAKLKEREETQKTVQELEKQRSNTELEERRKSFDTEWYDLVHQGKMPAVEAKTQEKINKGETLTMEEIQADAGLSARLELAKVSGGKSAKIAFYEEYNKEPVGASAPVIGTRPSSPAKENKELDYDRDVAPLRKRMFGF